MTTSIRTTSGFLLAAPRRSAVLHVAGLADDLDVGLGVEQQVQAGADDRVVVDDQHPDWRFLRHRKGTSATIVVPEPSVGLDREPTAEQADSFLHADAARARPVPPPAPKPRPSSSTIDGHQSPRAG